MNEMVYLPNYSRRVHTNLTGYKIMEPLAEKAIAEAQIAVCIMAV